MDIFTDFLPLFHQVLDWGRLNIKMSYQYKDPHVKDKTVSRPCYLYDGYPNTWKRRCLYIETVFWRLLCIFVSYIRYLTNEDKINFGSKFLRS